MIQMEQVSYSYQKNKSPILNNVTLHESEPVIGAIWGRNGTDKTTLMSFDAVIKKHEGEYMLTSCLLYLLALVVL